MPTEDEWYKAAYHNNDGVTGNYFDYPTSSDAIDSDMANYLSSSGCVDVGSYAYPSPYGTFDQGGNVWEWNETVVNYLYRGQRGGGFTGGGNNLHASSRYYGYYTAGSYNTIGFRVVEIPEPGSLVLLVVGTLGLTGRKRRERWTVNGRLQG